MFETTDNRETCIDFNNFPLFAFPFNNINGYLLLNKILHVCSEKSPSGKISA